MTLVDFGDPRHQVGEKYIIDDWISDIAEAHENNDSPKPFKHVYAFVRNHQKMSRYDFKELHASICDIMNQISVNYGILMFAQGTYVFTEEPVDLNPLMIKLASGINFNGEVTEHISGINLVNSKLGR